MHTLEQKLAVIVLPIVNFLKWLAPVGDLVVRIWLAKIFFESGLTKIQSWESTVLLFTNLYHVPLLPPAMAAFLGTACEIILPVLLLIGLGGRIMILIFFIYNIVAMISYNFLWTPAGAAGLEEHINWALLLMVLMLHGPGKLSIDYWLHKRHHS
ncbi:MAG TPA: DoxX family protein [Coxiellaceae bacterium]|nr:DoxX family protein [Coxiellaceae bacterium]